MNWLIAVAAFVGDPAERTAIGHAHRHRFAGLRQAWRIDRRAPHDVAQRQKQRILGRPVEVTGM
jgi:hypothetical protein